MGLLFRAVRQSTPGLLLVAGLLLISLLLASHTGLARLGLSPAALGILLGVAVGNLWPAVHGATWSPGLVAAQKHLLRWGIVLFGFHLSLAQVLAIGRSGIAVDLIMVATTLLLGLWLGCRLLHLDWQTALLTSVGGAICGAAAIAATAPLLDAKADKVTAAVGTVVLFGTLGMGLYPLIDHWGILQLHPIIGTYVGSTVHEVAQVVAIGTGLGEEAARQAVVVKMLRVLLLMPFLLLLGLQQRSGESRLARMPWFSLGFLAAAGINSLALLPPLWVDTLRQAGALLLAAAMTALGLGTTFSRIRAAGPGPLALGGLLFVHLVVTGALVNHWLAAPR
jgi:uncharacterized integral membrane protein (TIGR00698 family)